MSYARRHSTNVCPGNRVRYTIPLIPGRVDCFFNIKTRDEQANGLYVLVGLYVHDQYYLYVITVYPIVSGRMITVYPIDRPRG